MKITYNKNELIFTFNSSNEVDKFKKQIQTIISEFSTENNKKKNIRYVYVGKFLNKKEEETLKEKFLKIKENML